MCYKPGMIALVAQAADTPAGPPWYAVLLDNGLLVVLLFIFLTAIISVVVKLWKKDKCLKFFRGYHVTYATRDGRCLWGDLTVYSRGVALRFDAAYTNARGIVKTAALVYESELDAGAMALCRIDAGLSDRERRRRAKQVRRSFRPNVFRRVGRWFRNLLDTLRDAFGKALTAIVGAVAKTRPGDSVVAQQQGSVNEIGQTLLGAAGNAYEPVLEAQIGKPVVIQIAAAGGGDNPPPPFELPGYLVDYTDKWLAVFNTEHDAVLEREELELTEGVTKEHYRVELAPGQVAVTSTSPDAVVVQRMESDGRAYDLATPLLRGVTLRLARGGAGGAAATPVRLVLERVRRIDVVAPRSRATIHFGGDTGVDQPRSGWFGLAPGRASDELEAATDPTLSEPRPAR